jgi:hypothetical protein
MLVCVCVFLVCSNNFFLQIRHPNMFKNIRPMRAHLFTQSVINYERVYSRYLSTNFVTIHL